MKKNLISLILALLCVNFISMAQTADEVQLTIKRMENPSTFCNGAPEAFSKFLQKFASDKDFFESRLTLPESEKAAFAAELKPENMKAMLPFQKDGEMYYQAFGELQYNKAYLECGYVDSFSTHIYEFTRNKQGLWTLSHIVPGD